MNVGSSGTGMMMMAGTAMRMVVMLRRKGRVAGLTLIGIGRSSVINDVVGRSIEHIEWIIAISNASGTLAGTGIGFGSILCLLGIIGRGLRAFLSYSGLV